MVNRNLAMILLSPLLAGCPSGAGLLTSQGQSWGAMQSAGELRAEHHGAKARVGAGQAEVHC